MFGSARSGANAYAKVGMETGVLAANPHKLIVMLFDGLQVALATALMQMKEGNIAAKGKAISKAMLIIDSGLRASLDKTAGGEIAGNLDRLYEYMNGRLLQANLKNEPETIEEVQRLVEDIKQAWLAIDPIKGAASSGPQSMSSLAPMAASYDPLAPKTSQTVKA